MIKVGLIGCGSMGRRHSECYAALTNVEIVAVADVRKECAEKLSEKFNCKAYESGEALIADADVDAVDICLPTFLHTSHAVSAMEKGINVFIEKPVCLNEEEAALLLETEKKTGVKVMVGHAIRFWDEYTWLKSVVDSKEYGKILSAVFKRVSSQPSWSWENWFNVGERSGSVALDLHIHDVDYMRWIMGEPNNFVSKATRDEGGLIEQIFTTYEYDDAVVFIEAGWDYPQCFPFSMEYRVKFEKATVTFEAVNGCVVVYPADGEPTKPIIEKKCDVQGEAIGNLTSADAYYNELKYFISCIENNEKIERAALSDSVKSALLALDEINSVGGVIKK